MKAYVIRLHSEHSLASYIRFKTNAAITIGIIEIQEPLTGTLDTGSSSANT